MTDDTIHFVLTVGEGNLEELADRQKTEGERHAALLEIMLMMLSGAEPDETEAKE